jgi:hypothetical protein
MANGYNKYAGQQKGIIYNPQLSQNDNFLQNPLINVSQSYENKPK